MARTAPVSIHSPADSAPEERSESREYVHASVLAYSEELRRVAYAVPLLPDEWFDASTFSNYTVRLTPEELNAVKAELGAVIRRYRDREDQGTGVPVSLQLHGFPLLEPDSDG